MSFVLLPRAAVARPLRAGAVGLLLGLSLGVRAAAPPLPPSNLEQLGLAVAEARRNCARARDPRALLGPDRPLFVVRELTRALAGNPLLGEAEHGELEALREEARWLGGLRPTSPLGDRSWEDVRFLAGLLHFYLESCYAWERRRRTPGLPPPSDVAHLGGDLDPAKLRVFAGQTFEDVLGSWD